MTAECKADLHDVVVGHGLAALARGLEVPEHDGPPGLLVEIDVAATLVTTPTEKRLAAFGAICATSWTVPSAPV